MSPKGLFIQDQVKEAALESVVDFLDKVTFRHEMARELLKVGELKLCAEFLCESIGDNAVPLTDEIREIILSVAIEWGLDEDYTRVVRHAAKRLD